MSKVNNDALVALLSECKGKFYSLREDAINNTDQDQAAWLLATIEKIDAALTAAQQPEVEFVSVQSTQDGVWLHVTDYNKGGYSLNLDALGSNAKRCAEAYRARLAAAKESKE